MTIYTPQVIDIVPYFVQLFEQLYCSLMLHHTLCSKKGDTKLVAVTLLILNRFSKFFHWQILC